MSLSVRLRLEPLDARITPAVISDNLSAASAGVESATGGSFVASAFRATTAQTLTSVTLKLANPIPGTATVRIFSNAQDQPGTAISTLSSPADFSTSAVETTFTSPGLALAAGTTYWVVLSAPSGQFDWSFTNSSAGTGSGFTGTFAESANSGGAWSVFTAAPVQMRVTTADATAAGPRVAAGNGSGPPTVSVYSGTGSLVGTITAFEATFTGGVRTAVADLTGDGVPDVIAGTGPGRATRVNLFDGSTGAGLGGIDPFEAAFTGGVFVAAGDVDGDGRADIVVTPDQGGGPRVDIYSGNGLARITGFFAFADDPNFRGGARASVGDVNNDGSGDIVVSAGFGGGPRIATFDGSAVTLNGGTPGRLFGDFFAFENTLRNGAFVAAGDINADGRADLVFGGGPGGGPRVLALSGADLLNGNQQTVLANFFAGDTSNRGGVRVVAKDLNADGRADVVTGAGTGGGGGVTAYQGSSLAAGGTATAFALTLTGTDGVFVG